MKRGRKGNWYRDIAVLLFLLFLTGRDARGEDRVWLKGEENPEVGKIVAMDAEQVTLEIPGGRMGLKRSQIEKMEMEEPELFRDAKKASSEKEYVKARIRYHTVRKRFVDSEWADKAHFAIAECYEKEGNSRGARKTYKEIVKRVGKTPQGRKALLGIATLDHKAKRYKKAIEACTDIIDSDESRQGARASKLRGECYFAQDEYEDALISYLTVAVLYYREKDLAGECSLLAGKCFEKMGDTKRAREYYQEVKERFSSQLQRRATEELSRLDAGE